MSKSLRKMPNTLALLMRLVVILFYGLITPFIGVKPRGFIWTVLFLSIILLNEYLIEMIVKKYMSKDSVEKYKVMNSDLYKSPIIAILWIIVVVTLRPVGILSHSIMLILLTVITASIVGEKTASLDKMTADINKQAHDISSELKKGLKKAKDSIKASQAKPKTKVVVKETTSKPDATVSIPKSAKLVDLSDVRESVGEQDVAIKEKGKSSELLEKEADKSVEEVKSKPEMKPLVEVEDDVLSMDDILNSK